MPSYQLDPRTCQSSRVLVLDDDRSSRGLLLEWLCDAGYQADGGADANEAIARINRDAVDVVVSDVQMPGVAGLDLLARLQCERPEFPVIVLTGNPDPRLAAKAIENGARGYLLKPVRRQDLLAQVGKVLDRQRFLRAAIQRMENLERQVNEQTRLVRLAHEDAVHRLVVASMVRDDETGAHIQRIGMFSAVVAELAGWSTEAVDNIRLAAPMHDIGKIGIPDAILLKPGKLTAEEFEIMKNHTSIGASILRNSESPMMQLAEQIARAHHERWDGEGYPRGLRGEAIPLAARIVSIVDVYDALTHDRVYRKALPEPEAVSLIEQGRRTQFDPQLLDIFLAALPVIRELAREKTDEPIDQSFGVAEPVLRFKQSLALQLQTAGVSAGNAAQNDGVAADRRWADAAATTRAANVRECVFRTPASLHS